MLPVPETPVVATHWGTYRARMEHGRPVALVPIESDPAPSPIGSTMIEALDDACRIRRPMVRRSFLENGHGAGGKARGGEPFIEVGWDLALELVAGELDRVRTGHGNGAIYGGSYGWASAGRFHHAQSQIHRFLNLIGGYTRSVQNYSFAAAHTILPHVIGDHGGLESGHTSWSSIVGSTKTLVAFGGLSGKNSQVSAGGVARHILPETLAALKEAGCRLVSISPVRDDTPDGFVDSWLAIRPGSDVALMLALAHVLVEEGLHDQAFLDRFTTGFDIFRRYLLGESEGSPKTPEWAAALCDLPADEIRSLARRMAATRTMIMVSWSLQRADHGEQPCWMAITLAAILGQIGLPGGGFGIGYGCVNGIGNPVLGMAWPSLDQGTNAVDEFIPVARIADMLLGPGGAYDFNGQRRRYPDIRMVYWAGGNPFHHHQDINLLLEAWRKPETVIVHESWWNALARHADIVLPATTQLERNDIVCSKRDQLLAASHRITTPVGEARSDYEIFAGLASRLGVERQFTEGRDEEDWLRAFYAQAREELRKHSVDAPDFDTFWTNGMVALPEPAKETVLLSAFRADPERHPLATPSGRIEIFSDRIAGFGYEDCPGHPAWLEPREWLGATAAGRFPLHLLSNQPKARLHSQYDNGPLSRATKIKGREPIRLNPDDAEMRGISDGDVVRVFNDRGACLAAAVMSPALRRGVVQLSTGAWYDPDAPGMVGALDKHGNPNVLTRDEGTSRLAQGPSPQSCLVEVERFGGELPLVTAFEPPRQLPVRP